MIAEIIPSSKSFGENDYFSYSVPLEFESQIHVGQMVEMPFGKKIIRGMVAKLCSNDTEVRKYELKAISKIIQGFQFPLPYIEIVKWLAEYYLCSLGEALLLFLPPVLKRPRADQGAKKENRKTSSEIKLSKDQNDIFENILANLNANQQKKPVLLHGVTGSGKTEIYLKLALEFIAKKQNVIVLVPEIILTPQTVERFEKIFGDQIALLHSGLSKTEKLNCYHDFQSGKKPIIVGPRSALLVPVDNLGLIIVDEEHEDSYKQESTPRYHAVTLAEKIAEQTGALLLLGSATPRIETFFKAKSGKYDLFILSNRYQKKTLPSARIVDLRNEIKGGNFSPLSFELQKTISEILENKRQTLLFLNRRGTATFVSCRDCGHVILCHNCSIPMVYHTSFGNDKLRCHHCNFETSLPANCPSCGSIRIKYFGAGIDKIESEVKNQYPSARVIKIDSTTVKSKNDYEHFYKMVKNHEVDIIIGTQMIAKGLDLPGVDLVGIVSADTGLHLPHYRASERSFQLLTQVSGRSGRRDNAGQTIIQTYWPEALPILAASRHDYLQFYDEEIIARKTHNYPPYCHLIRVISEHQNIDKARQNIEGIIPKLSNTYDFIGPGACFYAKLHQRFRFHLIIKAEKWPDQNLHEIAKMFPHLTWDIEPTNML
ncbi:MAG: primosomal protein N' [Candidatus Berkelbacteria bacterium]|nr:primosomal protein N' [Candidatus Berkelbacteria bacterium]